MQFDGYIQELSKIKLLEPEEEKSLWQAYKDQGDMDARKKLIEAYQPLVFKNALPFRRHNNIMDIIQEGTVGLIEAVERYDPRRGVAFSLYAMHRIRGRMLDFLSDEDQADLACLDATEGTLVAWKEKLLDLDASVAEQAETHEAVSHLRRAMQRLPQKERTVLEGVYLESEEVSTIAAELKVSASYICRLQKRGLRRVRGMLANFMHNWK